MMKNNLGRKGNRWYRGLSMCIILTLLCGIVGCGTQKEEELCEVSGCDAVVYRGDLCERHYEKEEREERSAQEEIPRTDENSEDTEEPGATEALEPTPTPAPTPTQVPTPTSVPTPTPAPSFSLEELKNAQIGDSVTFGNYEQDNRAENGVEKIEWYVLDRQEDEILLFSKYLLDALPYHEEQDRITWEVSTLRKWLNNEFYNAAFGSEEQKYIKLSNLINADNVSYGTKGGADTKDKVFLFSLEEVQKYFSLSYGTTYYYTCNDERIATKGTSYAKTRGVSVVSAKVNAQYAGNSGWWLRSPGELNSRAMYVGFSPEVLIDGAAVDALKYGVRPSLWLNLSGITEDEITDSAETEKSEEATVTLVPEATSAFQAEALKKAQIGDAVILGAYEQDNVVENGAEDIEWYVLDRKGDDVLLLSRYCLDAWAYNKKKTSVEWENCTLRQWLNNEFYETAFGNAERSYIKMSNLTNEDNGYTDGKGGPDTKDKVFLLSMAELNEYFSFSTGVGFSLACDDRRLRAKVTEYAFAMGASESESNGKWWLRSPGSTNSEAAVVDGKGSLSYSGGSVNESTYSVRPAMWINVYSADDEVEYEPVVTPGVSEIPTVTPEVTITEDVSGGLGKYGDVKVGDTVKLGTYEQDNMTENGAEEIEWYVIDKNGDEVLLLSKYCLDAKPYNEDVTFVYWSSSDLRKWLNDDFYYTAFNKEDQKYVKLSTLTSERNTYYNVSNGGDTEDRVFLLSLAELEKYFTFSEFDGAYWECDDSRLPAKVTEYAIAQGASVSVKSSLCEYEGNDSWWIRMPGKDSRYAAYVSSEGNVYGAGTNVNYRKYGVRPALWMNLNGTEETENTNENAIPILMPSESSEEQKEIHVGDLVTFGSYEQDNVKGNGAEAIEWQVIAENGDEVLLLSKYCLDVKPYQNSSSNVTWESCSIREWLNKDFLNAAFSSEAQNFIKLSALTNEDNGYFGTEGGENTEDKVFLLSAEDINTYFGPGKIDEDYLQALVTEYTISQRISREGDYGNWWLRSPGYDNTRALYVNTVGETIIRGGSAKYSYYAVRPALWLKLNP